MGLSSRFFMAVPHQASRVARVNCLAAPPGKVSPERHILRCFSMRGDLRAVFPVVAQLADKVERPGDNYGVVRRGPVEGMFESRFWLGHDREASGVVRCDFGKPGNGNGARGTRLREDYLGGKRKKNSCHFVDGFVAQRSKDQPNFAASKILLQESGEFSGGGRVVRAVEVHVRV